MDDYKKLLRESRIRHRPTRLSIRLAGEYEFADVCPTCGSKAPCQSAQLADAVQALVAERDALRAKLDGMLTETRVVRLDLRNGKIIESEIRFQKRLVGPWVEVTD